MKIAVFGATGGTGRQFVDQALAAGHQITALVRTPAKLDKSDAGLTVVQGDVLTAADVADTLTGAEAVFCTLGSGSGGSDQAVSQGTANIVAAMQAQGVDRLVVITSLGVGDSRDQVPFAFKMLMKTVLRHAMQEKEIQEETVKKSRLAWTIIRPGGLSNGPAVGSYQAGLDRSIKAGQVSRGDVAAFALEQLGQETYVGKTPAITGA